jgi:hypothetical protein
MVVVAALSGAAKPITVTVALMPCITVYKLHRNQSGGPGTATV